MESYSCPPGSVVIFTESLVHAANDWTNPNNPLCAVFNCYNSIWAQWHRKNLDHETILKMPPKRRTLFRGTWALGEGGNREYSLDNRALYPGHRETPKSENGAAFHVSDEEKSASN